MLYEQISNEGVAFIFNLAQAGTITEDQARLLADEAVNLLNEDPYGGSSYESAWDADKNGATRVYLVSAYHRSRRYGGPEEGGWWYDHHEPLTEAYAQSHERAFLIAGPFTDEDDAHEVARDLMACEQIGMPGTTESAIVWRVQDHVPFEGNRAVYC
jgi:hypothetical protein